MSDLSLIPTSFFDVTPSDINPVCTTLGLYVGTAGVLKLAGNNGVIGTFQATAGQYLTGRFHRVMATGTTASGIVALFA